MMPARPAIIRKPRDGGPAGPQFGDHARSAEAFSWPAVADELGRGQHDGPAGLVTARGGYRY